MTAPRFNRREILYTWLCSGLLSSFGVANAQSAYPSQPVKLVVPVTTGGPSDLVARLLGKELQSLWSQSVVIENRPGASQVVGAAYVAKANPDGYTLLQAAANMAINPFLMNDLPYDTVKDFQPITLTHLTPYVVVVSAQSSVQSFADLIERIRKASTPLTYGSTGPGSPQQLATLLLAQQLKLPAMTEVPFKGSSAAHPDLIANRVDFMIDPLAASGPHIKSGLLRALAVTTRERNGSFPQIPTALEQGANQYVFASWGGVFAPARLPASLVRTLNQDIRKILSNPEVMKKFDSMGLVAQGSTPEDFGTFVVDEMNRWRALIKP
jgi:tripartite-type tricarboxylate transporter receptor subunit TctC